MIQLDMFVEKHVAVGQNFALNTTDNSRNQLLKCLELMEHMEPVQCWRHFKTRLFYLNGCDKLATFARHVKPIWKTGKLQPFCMFLLSGRCVQLPRCALVHHITYCFHALEQSRETATCKAQDVVAAALRLDGHALQHASEATRDDVPVWFHLVPCKSFSNHVMILSHMCGM